MAVILLCLIGMSSYVMYNWSTEKVENDSDLLLSNNILENTSKEDVAKTVTNLEITDDINYDSTVDSNLEVVTEETTTIDENEEINLDNQIVYDNLTKEELVDKLNRNLNSTLSGTGELFANYALELGMDPYLSVAIVLHETGCSWDCSDLVKYCYNVGGQKGSPGCGGGEYASFSSLEEGISNYMNNLYTRYYSQGLTTPESINPKYAASTTWATKVNYYIDKIRAS